MQSIPTKRYHTRPIKIQSNIKPLQTQLLIFFLDPHFSLRAYKYLDRSRRQVTANNKSLVSKTKKGGGVRMNASKGASRPLSKAKKKNTTHCSLIGIRMKSLVKMSTFFVHDLTLTWRRFEGVSPGWSSVACGRWLVFGLAVSRL